MPLCGKDTQNCRVIRNTGKEYAKLQGSVSTSIFENNSENIAIFLPDMGALLPIKVVQFAVANSVPTGRLSFLVPTGRLYVSPGWSEAATRRSATLGTMARSELAPKGAALTRDAESRAVPLGLEHPLRYRDPGLRFKASPFRSTLG